MAHPTEALRFAVTLVGPSRPLVGDKSCQPGRKTGTAKRGISRRVELIPCPEPLSRVRYPVPPITRSPAAGSIAVSQVNGTTT